jgi:hypothetical protein
VRIVIHAVHNGAEIEAQLHQLENGMWKCDYAIVKHSGQVDKLPLVDQEFSTMDLARDHVLKEAQDAIAQATWTA